ncbi:MAG: hypothetical protein DRJ56_02675 [Thermoprotei archaeon]|nr:MAG: hypothetical protein DRJ56_02675 [Thermoprotei archaeon]
MGERRLRVVRVVVPARDFSRVAPVVSELERRAVSVKRAVKRIFDERPDLDSVEFTIVVSLTKDEVRRYRRDLGRRLSGTIGFFLIYNHGEPSVP